jgi:hypothetical protein
MRFVLVSHERIKELSVYSFKSLLLFIQAAIGILTYSQEHLEVQLKESWYIPCYDDTYDPLLLYLVGRRIPSFTYFMIPIWHL